MNKRTKTSRLFFALWPDDHIRRDIVETFSRFPRHGNGRAIQVQNLHMTLHFVGSVSEDVKACLHKTAKTIRFDGFECKLDRYDYFRSAKIVWMGCQDAPVELLQLHYRLGKAIETCGYDPEKRAFTPHITLLRKCIKPDPAQADFCIPWFVNEFALLESQIDRHGVSYQLIEKYPA